MVVWQAGRAGNLADMADLADTTELADFASSAKSANCQGREGWQQMGWKNVERVIARRLGGERVGNRGSASPDVVSSWLAVEVKHRKALPAWLKDAIAQAKATAGDKLPLVVLHESGRWHDGDLVLLRLRDFEAWFGDCQDLGDMT